MCQLQTYAKQKSGNSKHTANSRQTVEQMLRDIAFVLHMTRKVKDAILAGK